ncbi:iron-containing redox enzyme family protein [Methyloglobulus sp.]|uniref:TenA family transcriptional regulator n=1 Tax=Methyloglobulus sp. TaxID=2518622 RepID=UPI0032B70780
MKQTSRAPFVTAAADAVLKKYDIRHNPYFESLTNGTMSLDRFRQTQEQFFWAVTFFPRPMSALVARIPDPQNRLDILHNLVEEHGEFQEQFFHHTTFQQFLKSIGSNPEHINDQPLCPALRAFNSVLTASCVLDELEVGIACMGIIEFVFADISATIGKAVVQNGWVEKDQLVHYKLHADIDERHAEEFFVVIESQWNDPQRRYYIEQGLALGAYIFNRLYTDLFDLSV